MATTSRTRQAGGSRRVLLAAAFVAAVGAIAAVSGFRLVHIALRPDTFTVTGYYVYPVMDGQMGNEACRGRRSREGILIQVKKLTRKTANLEVGHTRLPAGHFVEHWEGYGAGSVCVYPFTVKDVPSGALGYGANAACDPGTAFTEREASGVIVDGYVQGNVRLHPRQPHCHQR